MTRIGEHISVQGTDAHCAECDESLGPVDENLKLGLVVQEKSVEEAGPYYVDPERFVGADVVFREYYCPGCGTLLFNETAQPDDDPVSEVELDPETL